MEKKLQKFLLSLSRQTLVDYFTTGEKLKVDLSDLPDKKLVEKAATFVTLEKNGELRGCIGNLVAKKSLYEDVINNTLMAGFGDPRFLPLAQNELKDIRIEISVLSAATPFKHDSPEDLLQRLEAGKHGVILQQDYAQATFLPQVWKDIPDKVKFMEQLSQKAGLPADAWKDQQAEIFYYTVESFHE